MPILDTAVNAVFQSYKGRLFHLNRLTLPSNSDDDEFGFSYTLFHILSAFYILVVAVSVLSFITDMIYNVQMIRHSGLMAVFSFMALYSLIADLCNISGTLISLPNLVAQNLQLK
jgi:hypothetical protein